MKNGQTTEPKIKMIARTIINSIRVKPVCFFISGFLTFVVPDKRRSCHHSADNSSICVLGYIPYRAMEWLISQNCEASQRVKRKKTKIAVAVGSNAQRKGSHPGKLQDLSDRKNNKNETFTLLHHLELRPPPSLPLAKGGGARAAPLERESKIFRS